MGAFGCPPIYIEMQETVYTEFLSLMGEAITVADEAVKAAEAVASQSAQQPEISLVKVASSRYAAVAGTLFKTGAFESFGSAQQLSAHLEKSGAAGHLEVMEKLASSAVFPFGSSLDLSGELVEKPSTHRNSDSPRSKTAIWRQSMDEAEFEVSG